MALTITQVLESFFIALMLVLITSPQLISAQSFLHELSHVFQLFH